MDIPWDVDKALEVLQESGKLRMENIKKGGNSFGRELQEEPLKIFTHCKQIPGAMEGWNFNLQQSCSRTGVTNNKFRGLASGAWVNIPKIQPQSLSLCQRRGFHSASSSWGCFLFSCHKESPPKLYWDDGRQLGLPHILFWCKHWYFVSLEHSWCCSWMKKMKSCTRCAKINFHLQAEIQQNLKNCIL